MIFPLRGYNDESSPNPYKLTIKKPPMNTKEPLPCKKIPPVKTSLILYVKLPLGLGEEQVLACDARERALLLLLTS